MRRLAENEQAYITATQERERYIREVFSRPVGQRPAIAEICAATGLSHPWLNRIRAKPARPWGKVRPEQAKAIREWARAHGFTVSDRGPLPIEVLDAYFGAA